MAKNNLKAIHYHDRCKDLFGEIVRAGKLGRKASLESKANSYTKVQQNLIGRQARACQAYKDKSEYDVSKQCERCTVNPFSNKYNKSGKYKKHLV